LTAVSTAQAGASDDMTRAANADSTAATHVAVVSSSRDDITRIAAGGAGASDLSYQPGAFLAQRYRIVRPLGRGGMGAVFLADDERLGQRVALKLLPPALARDPHRLAQFQNEVRLARQISHPNVCRVYDIGDADGHLFLSMEYVEGEDLAARLERDGPFGALEGVDLVWQIGAGLAAVHAAGVLHRDLKPANVMLSRTGQAKLMDFGIATAGAVGDIREGTPAYMAPEQMLGEPISERSDVYALGHLVYEIFTGHRLFEGRTPTDLLTYHQSSTGSPALGGVLSPAARALVSECLERDPGRRPASVRAAIGRLPAVLLDARTIGRRVVQVAAQLGTVFLIVAGYLVFRGGDALGGLAWIVAGLVVAATAWWLPVGWSVRYKGHRIRFHNHPVWGERLYIDDALVDRGRVRLNVTMRGTLEGGAGAGERITATCQARFFSLSCRMVSELFLP
jgi:predicted Ser/Thr protein kinase